MATKLDIFNTALPLVGVSDQLTDPAGASKAHIILNRFYPTVVDEFLTGTIDWSFVRKRATLTPSETITPPTNWSYAFEVPADYLKLRSIVIPGLRAPAKRQRIPFEMATVFTPAAGGDGPPASTKRVIYCDLSEIEVVYTTKLPDESVLPSEAAYALALLLASRIAVPMTMKADIMNLNRQAYNEAVLEAAAADLNEEEPDKDPLPELLEGRNPLITTETFWR